ncbi:hypothetical protein B566_EDAN010657 [Ephemera danica]|nr:hypothetical protein B566_EDAN010657 [Ephemera danica]
MTDFIPPPYPPRESREGEVEETTPSRVEDDSHSDRVVSGLPAIPHQFPWLALLVLQPHLAAPALPWCGAAIISSLYVITAAHCIAKVDVSQMKVLVGLHDRCISERTTTGFSVVSSYIPDGFDAKLLRNDIALLRVSMPLTFGHLVKPICMPRPGVPYWGKIGDVAGWGKTNYSNNNPGSCILLRASLPVLSRAGCAESRYSVKQITRSHFCAGYVDRGDSGGPLMVARASDNRYELVGVVSGGQGCALLGFPGLYTRVTDFLPWIASLTADSPFCIRS